MILWADGAQRRVRRRRLAETTVAEHLRNEEVLALSVMHVKQLSLLIFTPLNALISLRSFRMLSF